MLVGNVLQVTDKTEKNIKGIETVRDKKDFRDILIKYMGYEVAEWFNNYSNNLENEIYRLENMVDELERETEIVKKYGAVFVIGIGGELSNGEYHDGRAPDYDDWSTETSPGYYGLNGDILVWNPVLDQAFELSSMGIRVDKSALLKQLAIRGCEERRELAFHKALLNCELPLSIGGGLGQSRLCMYLLRCAHIGEVQTSIWPDEMIRACADAGIVLR